MQGENTAEQKNMKQEEIRCAGTAYRIGKLRTKKARQKTDPTNCRPKTGQNNGLKTTLLSSGKHYVGSPLETVQCFKNQLSDKKPVGQTMGKDAKMMKLNDLLQPDGYQ
ncbi:MAG: hypothetical protein EAY75_15120 [Bacteroidetes bacterium]|nr:MAG: hypothetical protein EAY75_15120 [Bacteroidota bacterium]